MNKYRVKVEANEYEVDAPDENTAWAWANYYHQQNPPKQEEINPFRESIGAVGRGVLGGIATAAHGVGSLVSSGADLLGARDTADRWRAENDELLKKNREYFDKTISPPTTLPGKVIEGVSNLAPVIAGGPLTLAPSVISMANQTQKSLNDQGVPPQTASNVAVAQTAANTALMAIPVLKPAMSIILNSGSGVAADAISAQLLNEYKEAQDPYTPKSEQYWVNRAIELILGYGFSNKSKNTVQRDVGDTPPKPAEPSVEPNKGFFTGEGQEIKPESLTPNKLDQVPTSEHYYKMAEDLASRGDAEGFKTAIDEANRLKAMEIGEQITTEEKGLPALWERADTEVPTLGKKPETPETPLPEIKSDIDSGTPYHPEAMKAAIERDALDKQITAQYERILKMEEMISGEGMTSEMLPMRDKLVESEYNKLAELQSKRDAAESGIVPAVPKSQRGGAKGTWNPFEVRKALEKKFREVYEGKRKLEAVNIRTPDDVKEQVFAKAGIKGLQLIPDVPKLSPELIAKFKEIPDVGPHNLLQSGAMSKIEHNNRNQLLLWQHRVLDRGYKIGQWMNMKWVRPVENQMYSILRNDRNVRALHDVFMEELNSKTRHSPEQLASKLSPELQTAYKNMRDLFDKTIQEVNKAEDALGLKRTDPHTAYYSAVFSGPWRFTVYAKNEDGTFRPVWHVAERSRGQAKKALKYLRGQGFQNGLFYTPIKYDGTHSSGSIFKGQFKELLEMFDKSDPVHQQIKDVMEQLALGSTEIKGTEKHFIPKTGVRGFQGDRPWVNPVKDARDGFIAQFQYIKNALDWAGYQQGMREVKTLMDELNKDPAYSDTHPNTLKWMKDYADSHAGIATIKSFEGLQNDLAKALGTDVRFLETLLGGSKSGFYIHTLGWNAPFLATQIIQPVFTAPQHVKISERGFDHNAGKTHVEGSFYGLLAFGKDSAQWMHEQGIPMFEGDLHGVWKDAFDYLQANRLIDINPTSDIQELHRPQGLRMVSDWGSSPIIVSERIARSMAFFSFVSHYNQSGMFKNTVEDRLAMFRLAEEATNLSMVDYRPQEKPMIFSKMGLVGNALNTFQAYKFNYLNQYVAYAGQALKGKPAAFMTMTALGLAYAGVQGMVGLEDADALLDLIKAAWPAKYLGGLPPEVLKFTIRGFVLDNFPKYVSVGPVSSISGLNMYSRFSMADVTPLGEGSPLRMLSQIFPWAGFLAQGFKSIYDLLAPDSSYKEKIAAGYFLTPSGLKGLYEESWPGTKTKEGLSLDPRDIDRGKYRRSETESAVRKWGFYGVDEAMSRDKSYRNKATDRWYSEEKKRIADSFRSNFIHGKIGPMERQIKRYISMEGDVETLLSQAELQKAFIEMNTTEKERIILAAQSGKYPAVARMLRYLK